MDNHEEPQASNTTLARSVNPALQTTTAPATGAPEHWGWGISSACCRWKSSQIRKFFRWSKDSEVKG